MKLFYVDDTVTVAASLLEVWRFFSNPNNLRHLTPLRMNFRFREAVPDAAFAGLLLPIEIRPWGSWPVRWVSEINEVDAPAAFCG